VSHGPSASTELLVQLNVDYRVLIVSGNKLGLFVV